MIADTEGKLQEIPEKVVNTSSLHRSRTGWTVFCTYVALFHSSLCKRQKRERAINYITQHHDATSWACVWLENILWKMTLPTSKAHPQSTIICVKAESAFIIEYRRALFVSLDCFLYNASSLVDVCTTWPSRTWSTDLKIHSDVITLVNCLRLLQRKQFFLDARIPTILLQVNDSQQSILTLLGR